MQSKEDELSSLQFSLASKRDFFTYFSRAVHTEASIRKILEEKTCEGFLWRISDSNREGDFSFVVNHYKPKSFSVPEEILSACESIRQVDFFERLFYQYNHSDILRVDDEYFRMVFGKTIPNWKPAVNNIMKNTGYYCDIKTWDKGNKAVFFLKGSYNPVKVEENVPKKTTNTAPKIDVVYLISDGVHQKIGKTNNVERRIKALQTSNSKRLELIAVYPDPKYTARLERLLHERYKDSRLVGEWFDINLSAEEFISCCKYELENW